MKMTQKLDGEALGITLAAATLLVGIVFLTMLIVIVADSKGVPVH